jgi:antitoxin MazE
MLSKIQKWGNSQGLRFTKALLQEAQINVGDEVNISVQNGRIIVEPATKVRGRYDLKELVSKIPQKYQAEELDWGEPVGKEEW